MLHAACASSLTLCPFLSALLHSGECAPLGLPTTSSTTATNHHPPPPFLIRVLGAESSPGKDTVRTRVLLR